MAGYLNNASATAEVLDADGWLRTGDLGRVDDGDVYVVDRRKELIKVSAYQVAPAELEALLLGHPGVADAAVIPARTPPTARSRSRWWWPAASWTARS